MDKNYLLSLNWPPALLKALDDPFEYLITLRTGEEIYFTNAKYLNSDFVKLDGIKEWPRGIEVRVSDIMYIADAPNGV